MFGLTEVQRIKNGGQAKLSKRQIVFLIISLNAAKANLSPKQYYQLECLFGMYRRDKQKVVMDCAKYLAVCDEMIADFEEIAPFELINGQ